MRAPSTPSQFSARALQDKLFARRKYSTAMLRKAVRRLSRPTLSKVPTEAQKQLLLTSFVLGCASIPMAIFPVCGLLAGITGLLLGLYGYRTTTLKLLSAWAVVLSIAGLLLTLVNLMILCNIYFNTYIW